MTTTYTQSYQRLIKRIQEEKIYTISYIQPDNTPHHPQSTHEYIPSQSYQLSDSYLVQSTQNILQYQDRRYVFYNTIPSTLDYTGYNLPENYLQFSNNLPSLSNIISHDNFDLQIVTYTVIPSKTSLITYEIDVEVEICGNLIKDSIKVYYKAYVYTLNIQITDTYSNNSTTVYVDITLYTEYSLNNKDNILCIAYNQNAFQEIIESLKLMLIITQDTIEFIDNNTLLFKEKSISVSYDDLQSNLVCLDATKTCKECDLQPTKTINKTSNITLLYNQIPDNLDTTINLPNNTFEFPIHQLLYKISPNFTIETVTFLPDNTSQTDKINFYTKNISNIYTPVSFPYTLQYTPSQTSYNLYYTILQQVSNIHLYIDVLLNTGCVFRFDITVLIRTPYTIVVNDLIPYNIGYYNQNNTQPKPLQPLYYNNQNLYTYLTDSLGLHDITILQPPLLTNYIREFTLYNQSTSSSTQTYTPLNTTSPITSNLHYYTETSPSNQYTTLLLSCKTDLSEDIGYVLVVLNTKPILNFVEPPTEYTVVSGVKTELLHTIQPQYKYYFINNLYKGYVYNTIDTNITMPSTTEYLQRLTLPKIEYINNYSLEDDVINYYLQNIYGYYSDQKYITIKIIPEIVDCSMKAYNTNNQPSPNVYTTLNTVYTQHTQPTIQIPLYSYLQTKQTTPNSIVSYTQAPGSTTTLQINNTDQTIKEYTHALYTFDNYESDCILQTTKSTETYTRQNTVYNKKFYKLNLTITTIEPTPSNIYTSFIYDANQSMIQLPTEYRYSILPITNTQTSFSTVYNLLFNTEYPNRYLYTSTAINNYNFTKDFTTEINVIPYGKNLTLTTKQNTTTTIQLETLNQKGCEYYIDLTFGNHSNITNKDSITGKLTGSFITYNSTTTGIQNVRYYVKSPYIDATRIGNQSSMFTITITVEQKIVAGNIKCKHNTATIYSTDGSIYVFGNTPTQTIQPEVSTLNTTNIPTLRLTNIKDYAVGEDVMYYIKNTITKDGIYMFGKDYTVSNGSYVNKTVKSSGTITYTNYHDIPDLCASSGCMFVDNSNKMLAFGNNTTYALGIGSPSSIVSNPSYCVYQKNVGTGDLLNINTFSIGKHYSVVVDTNGRVYIAGINNTLNNISSVNNQTFTGTFTGKITTKVKTVDTQYYHTFIINDIGTKLYSFGNNTYRQLGVNSNTNFNEITVVGGISLTNNTCIAVAVGERHSVCVLSNGDVYTCGDNTYGQLGYQGNSSVFKKVVGISGAKNVQCCKNTTYVLTNTGNVYSFGSDEYGLLGIGSNIVGDIWNIRQVV